MSANLSKYPVKGLIDEYRVDVFSDYIGLGLKVWKINVYKYNEKALFKKYKKLNTYSCHPRDYHKLNGQFVQMAKDSIKEYEDSLIAVEQFKYATRKGIKEFEEWDGK